MRWIVGFAWVAVGVLWYASPFGRGVVDSICGKLSVPARKLAAPLGLALAAGLMVGAMFLLQLPFAHDKNGMTFAGMALALVFGSAFVSIQVVSALVTIRGLAGVGETARRPVASNSEDHES